MSTLDWPIVRLARCIVAQAVRDLANEAEYTDACRWLLTDECPVDNRWRDDLCAMADLSLEGLRRAVTDAPEDRIHLIANMLLENKEYS